MSNSNELFSSPPLLNLFIPRIGSGKSPFDELCAKPGVKIEELLDDENFSFELKHCNTNLMDYFTKNPQQVTRLIEFITIMPPNPHDSKRAHQYPMLANEVFEEDIPVIMNCFFRAQPGMNGSPLRESMDLRASALLRLDVEPENNVYLKQLFNIVNQDLELNEVLAGYFANLVRKLLKRNPKKMIEFIYRDSSICYNMTKHIGNTSISELLSSIIFHENNDLIDKKIDYLNIKVGTIERIFKAFNNYQRQENMAQVSEILSSCLSNYKNIADGNQLVCKILAKDNFNLLFSTLKTCEVNSVRLYACSVIMTLLNFYIAEKADVSSILRQSLNLDSTGFSDDPVIMALYHNIDVLCNILQNNRSFNMMQTTFSNSLKPFGLTKLKAVEILEAIVRINDSKLNNQIHERDVIPLITTAFKTYVWNNLLHVKWEKIVSFILEKKSAVLLQSLFVKAGLVQLIVDEFKNDAVILPKNKKSFRKGNMGFIVQFANELNKLSANDSQIKNYLASSPDWERIVQPALKKRNDLEAIQIGGMHPKDLLETVLNSAPGLNNPDFASGYVSPLGDGGSLSFSQQIEKVDNKSTDSKISKLDAVGNSLASQMEAEKKAKGGSEGTGFSNYIEPRQDTPTAKDALGYLSGLQGIKSLGDLETKTDLLGSFTNLVSKTDLPKSMTDYTTIKFKFPVVRATKSQGKKILDLINKYQGKDLNSSIEFSFTGSAASESDNLTGDELDSYATSYKSPQFNKMF